MNKAKHTFRVRARGADYALTVEKPAANLVSMEYYFTYNREAELSARLFDDSEVVEQSADRFIPQAYFPDLIKSAVVRLNSAKPPSMKKLNRLAEAISSRSTQFPLIVLEGKSVPATAGMFVETLKPLVEKYNMYFLLLLRMKDVPPAMDPLFHAHREVYYSSRNRIFLKCLLEAEGGDAPLLERMRDLKNRNISADIIVSADNMKSVEATPDLSSMTDVWRDSYSEQNISHGPNVWVELRKKIKASDLLELDARIAKTGARRLYLHPSVHRLLNGYATLKPGGIRGTLAFNMDGTLFLEDAGAKTELGSWLEEDMAELISRQPACERADETGSEPPCGELRSFCLRSPHHCGLMQDIIAELGAGRPR